LGGRGPAGANGNASDNEKPRSAHAPAFGPDYLLEMLQRRSETKPGEYVFSGERGPLGDPKKQIAKVVAASGVKFSAHTLRRTFGTIAESLDIPAYAVKRMLNHRMSGDVTFQHYLVIDVERLREPVQRITDYVLKAAGAKPGAEVVELQRAG
jgi:integrase